MTELGIGLLLGLGLFLIWWACWDEPRRATRAKPAGRLSDLLIQAGVSGVTVRGVVGLSLIIGLVTAATATVFIAAPVVAICLGAMAAGGPWLLIQGRARRRQHRLRTLWPDVVENLTSGIRAGLSLAEALGQVGERGPEELREPFKAFAADYAVSGNFAQALNALKARLADPVADRVIETVRIAREVGGTDIGDLLRSLAGFLRADLRTRGEIAARHSWTIAGARLAVAAPWVVLVLLCTRPETAAVYAQPAGTAVVIGGGAATVVAYRLMLRLGRVADETRVLR